MMKGAIAEISGTKAIMLTECGEFITIRNKNYSIGQKVIAAQKTHSRLSTLAACFLLSFVLGGSVWGYYTPVTYIDIDINPSFRLALNIFDRVIDVKPLNRDAKDFLAVTKNLPDNMETCISELTTKAKELGYINNGNNELYIYGISTRNDFTAKLDKCTKKVADEENIKIYTNFEKLETLKFAKKHNISVGRVKLVEEYSETAGGTVDENLALLNSKTNKEIRAALTERKNQEAPSNNLFDQPQDNPGTKKNASQKQQENKNEKPKKNASEKPTAVPGNDERENRDISEDKQQKQSEYKNKNAQNRSNKDKEKVNTPKPEKKGKKD